MTRLMAQLLAALRAHLAGAMPAPPVAGRLVWQAFVGLSDGRRYDGGVPLSITAAEISAMEYRFRARWSDDLVAILLAMDRVWLAHMRDRMANPDKAKAVPLTASAFDGMFG